MVTFHIEKTKKPKKKPSLKAEEEHNLFNANDTKFNMCEEKKCTFDTLKIIKEKTVGKKKTVQT